jgi:hypothetical protein
MLHQDRNAITGRAAARHDGVCESIGGRIQLRIGRRPVFGYERRTPSMCGGNPLEAGGNCLFCLAPFEHETPLGVTADYI